MAKLSFSPSLETANRVLREVRKVKLSKSDAERELAYVVSYANGREQGYAVRVWSRARHGTRLRMICFAEARSSDAIVVYVDDGMSLFEPGNVPSSAAYHAAVYFKPGEYVKAARHIAKAIRIGLSPEKS